MDISVALNNWAQRKKLTEKERKAINMAIGNLYSSQRIEGMTWGECIKVIKKALEKVHVDEVWVDIQSDEVYEKEPKAYMDENPDYDPEDPESEEKIWYEPSWEDYVNVSLREVKAAILGDKELCSYV